MPNRADRLRSIKTFKQLVRYLEDELDWPLEKYGFDELTFEYSPAELGLKEEDADKVKIYQLRPIYNGQPWGIFFVEFHKKRMPVVVLRRILSHLVLKKRASANKAQAAAWNLDDLLFISAFGEQASDQREIAFAHFHQEKGDLPTLRVLGWDGADTALKLEHVDATLHERLRWPSNQTDVDAWRQQWSRAFRHRIGHVIRTADALAEVLATLARGIRDAARTLMDHESERGQLRKLHKAFQTALIHDLTEESFADTYAQTITYGLLTAAISRTEMSEGRHGTALIAENVADMVPITNPFLREMLETFIQAGGRKGGIDFDELGIQDVVELLRGGETDLPAILRDFGNRTRGEDPVIHFYEHFLKAYNKQLKIQRGVFYTPQPVVYYIVRSVHELLQTVFGLEDGLASTITWGEMEKRNPDLKIPSGVERNSPFVLILDPATGTATFLVEVIDVIYHTVMNKWKKAGLSPEQQRIAWNDYVPHHLLPRLYGYELMMAPYAIAHMKIGLKLVETGYRFSSDERVRIYLTNALECAHDQKKQSDFTEWVPALAHEANAVNIVKKTVLFTVVIGNPPYSAMSANMSEEVRESVKPYRYVDGVLIVEKSALSLERNLNDDYIKFMRLAESYIESAVGIVGMITNNSYLDSITLRGFRSHLLKTFSSLQLLDLHGDTDRRDTSSDGSPDQNVFEIKKGVAIALLSKAPVTLGAGDCSTYLYDLRGKIEEKYDWLMSMTAKTVIWHNITPSSDRYFFNKQDADLFEEYKNGNSLEQIMPTSATGFTSGRDDILTHFTDKEARGNLFFFSTGPVEAVKEKYEVEKAFGRQLFLKRAKIASDPEFETSFKPFLFAPFDIRSCFYQPEYLMTASYRVGQHLIRGNNLALMAMRQVSIGSGYTHIFVTRVIPNNRAFYSTKGKVSYFPLFLYPEEGTLISSAKEPRVANVTGTFIKLLQGSNSLASAKSDQKKQAAASEVASLSALYYCYAVLHSPTYRKRYDAFLRTDFPRIPVTTNSSLSIKLIELGAELVTLHLMESTRLDKNITHFVGNKNQQIEKVALLNGTIWIDKARTSGFSDVSGQVWDFHIGGYQVCEKWLKDRKDRKLSAKDIDHYQRLIVALNETIKLMDKIDEVIDQHGGWPLK